MKNFAFLVLVALAGCGKEKQDLPAKENETSVSVEKKISYLVLVNAGESDRCQIGELIRRISQCNPRVIGVNFLFVKNKDVKCDSTLRAAIIDSDKVVLIEGFEHDKHVESNQMFTEGAFLTGLTGLIKNEHEMVDQYYRMIDHRGKWELSFPFLLALQLHKNRAAELSSKLRPRGYPINFCHQSDEFNVVDSNADFAGGKLLEGKIVIVGYMGPTQEDIFKVSLRGKSSDNVYGTVIQANIIMDILKDLN